MVDNQLPDMAVDRIVFFSAAIGDPGGITTATNSLAAGFRSRGLSVSYMTLHPQSGPVAVPGDMFEVDLYRKYTADHPAARRYPGPLGVKYAVKRLLARPWRSLRRRRLRRYVKALPSRTAMIVTDIYCHALLWECCGDLLSSRFPSRPLIVLQTHTSVDGWGTIVGIDQVDWSVGKADIVTALSSGMAEQFAERYRVPVAAVQNPLRIPVRENVGDEGRQDRIVVLSRFSPEKRLPLLVRAFAEVAGEVPSWSLDIYGSGPEEARLRELIKYLGVPRVTLHPFTDDIVKILDTARLSAMVSSFEGAPMSVVEAAARGVPSVCTPASDMVVSVATSCGYLTDAPYLARDLLAAMHDTSRQAKVRACLEYATRFSPETVVDRWMGIFAAQEGAAPGPTRGTGGPGGLSRGVTGRGLDAPSRI